MVPTAKANARGVSHRPPNRALLYRPMCTADRHRAQREPVNPCPGLRDRQARSRDGPHQSARATQDPTHGLTRRYPNNANAQRTGCGRTLAARPSSRPAGRGHCIEDSEDERNGDGQEPSRRSMSVGGEADEASEYVVCQRCHLPVNADYSQFFRESGTRMLAPSGTSGLHTRRGHGSAS